MAINEDSTTAELMKRLMESSAATVDWSKARKILNVASREEAIEMLAEALIKARRELAEAKGAMALVVHSSSDHAIVTLDVLGNIVAITGKGPELLGWPLESMIGKPIDMLLADRYKSVAESSAEMKRADSGESVSAERSHVRADGTTFNSQHTLVALLGAGGYLTGFVRKIEDVTLREAHQIHIAELDATIALLIG